MAVRQDEVQLRIDFLTDESRALAGTINNTKTLQKEVAAANAQIAAYNKQLSATNLTEVKRNEILSKRAAAERTVATNLAKIAEEGKKVERLDLSKVAPAQLIERAKQLSQAIRLIPQSAPEFRQLQGELAAVNGRLREINQTAKGIYAGKGGGLLQQVLGVAGGVGVAQLVQGAIGSLVNFGRSALQELDKGLKADAQVQAAIKSTGGAAGKTFEELKGQAEDLAKITLFSDDDTKGAQALLLTFKNVKGEVFDQAIPLAQDLSTAFGQDLSASAVQLGKALDDPIRGVTALRRVGVSFSDDQQVLIKSLVETGRVAEAQAIILGELESQVGGSAKAAAEAGLGPYQVLQNRLGEVKESVGALIANGFQRLAPFLQSTVEFLEKLTERLTTGKRAVGEYSAAVEAVVFVFNVIAKAFQAVGILFDQQVAQLKRISDGFTEFIDIVKGVPVVGELFETFIITPIRFVSDAIDNLPAAWAGFVAATKQAANNVVEDLKGLVLNAKIFVKNIESALTFSADGKAKVAAELKSLESQKEVAAQAGKTIGQAYVEARDAVLAKSAPVVSGGSAKTIAAPPPKPTAEELEAARKRIEERLKVELQAVELGIQRRELLLENERIKGQVDEKAYQERLVQITEDGLRKKLDVYKVFHRDQKNEALKLQNELAVIEQGKTLQKVDINTISARPGEGVTQTKSSGADIAAGLSIQDVGEKARDAALKDRFVKLLITEQDYELKRLELKKQSLEEEIKILEEGGPQYAAAVRKREEEAYKIESEINEKKVENARRTEEFKEKLAEAAVQTAAGVFSLTAELLAEDERARKKNAGAIKAFQAAEVITTGILEAQRSYEAAVKSFGVPAGSIIGGILAAVAVARSSFAAAKIRATKFFFGGFTGQGYGAPDSTGHRQAGIVHAGEYVAPAWQVNSPETGPVVQWLESRRLRGYASGGFVAPNTTPSSNVSFSSSAASVPQAQNMDMFIDAVARFESTVAKFPKEVKSRVVYTEIEDAGTTLNTVRDEAAL